MWDLTTTKQYPNLRKKLLLFCFPSRGFPSRGSPPQPMWDITIHPFQGPAFSRTLVPFSKRCRIRTKSTPPSGPCVLLGTPPHVYSPSGSNVLAGTRSFLQEMWDPHQIHSLWGPTSLLAHRFMSTPFREHITIHPPSGPSVLAGTRSFLQEMWNPH